MADAQSPTVEIAPTVIVSNSNEGENNGEHISADSSEIPGDNEPGDGSGTGELSPHNNGEFVEDGTSPIVAVAEIEAGRDIALAEIHDETERERLRLEAERIEALSESNKEFEECQREIQELREKVEALTQLIQPPPLETEMEEQLEIVPETSLTEPSTAAPTVEMLTEPSEESVVESLEAEIRVSPGRRFIAI